MRNFLSKFHSKALFVLATFAVFAQNAFAEPIAGLEIPPGTDEALIGYINSAFGVIIGVVVVVIAAGLIIKMLRKAGG